MKNKNNILICIRVVSVWVQTPILVVLRFFGRKHTLYMIQFISFI